MVLSFLYLIFALLGISFLIFIHELGHYWTARRVGMRVETFSIGFGRPIYSWVSDGVNWQVCWILFGGYVKIAGQELDEKTQDPYSIPDGFFGKSPFDRIKVAVMGPVANLIFAILAFAALYALGGREKTFGEYTQIIGWVDPQSELYAKGVRPGDEVLSYDGNPVQSNKDHLYAGLLGGETVEVTGNKIDYNTGEKQPFSYEVKVYPHPLALDKGLKTAGIITTANYIMYDKLPGGGENPIPEGSPMQQSGIEYGDRIIWADGERVISSSQLSRLLNDERVLLTVERSGKTMLKRVPRVPVEELKLDAGFREELVDWQFEAKLNATKLQKLYAIPYNLTNDCVVENELTFIDADKQKEIFPEHPFSAMEEPLKEGDRIIAVDGAPVKRSYQLLQQVQTHHVYVIVSRNPADELVESTIRADNVFETELESATLEKIATSIGTGNTVKSAGDFILLGPIEPKMKSEFTLTPEKKAWMAAELQEQKKAIEEIEDPEKRAQAMAKLDSKEKELLLGLPMIRDRKVNYNPGPFALFSNTVSEIWRTLSSLVSGRLSPKWLSGPIGIVQAIHGYSMVSMKEALYWLGVVSLNLGVFNLLPVPPLDGGTIVFNLIEMVTGKKIRPKVLEKIVVPFVVLFIVFFLFVTYYDVVRMFSSFWKA